jgi:hypothetical protein
MSLPNYDIKVLNFIIYILCIMKEVLAMAMALALTLGITSTFTIIRGPVYAQVGTTSGNVTAQIAPQGTSLNTSSNKTTAASAANESGTTSGNVIAQIAPQGTSLNTSSNANSSKSK